MTREQENKSPREKKKNQKTGPCLPLLVNVVFERLLSATALCAALSSRVPIQRQVVIIGSIILGLWLSNTLQICSLNENQDF